MHREKSSPVLSILSSRSIRTTWLVRAVAVYCLRLELAVLSWLQSCSWNWMVSQQIVLESVRFWYHGSRMYGSQCWVWSESSKWWRCMGGAYLFGSTCATRWEWVRVATASKVTGASVPGKTLSPRSGEVSKRIFRGCCDHPCVH